MIIIIYIVYTFWFTILPDLNFIYIFYNVEFAYIISDWFNWFHSYIYMYIISITRSFINIYLNLPVSLDGSQPFVATIVNCNTNTYSITKLLQQPYQQVFFNLKTLRLYYV